MQNDICLHTIPEATQAIGAGKIVIVVDDECRENEGDFICAAECITPELVNFMSKEGRGLLCVSLIEERCEALGLGMMVSQNTALHTTPFTVSVDLLGKGCTTGISASDRSKTIRALVDQDTRPEDLGRPGHVFPLRARQGGVLRRAGHTEAAIDLARLAGLKPAGVLIEIMNEDGTMARLPNLHKIAQKHDLKLVSIQDLIAYRLEKESLIKREITLDIPTDYGNLTLVAYQQTYTQEVHLAFKKGTWHRFDTVTVRVQSSPASANIFGPLRQNFVKEIEQIMKTMQLTDNMVLLYINKEEKGIDLLNRLSLYQSSSKANQTSLHLESGATMDERDYGVGAQILRDLGVSKMRLITNYPRRRVGLIGYGLEVVDILPIE